MADDLGVRQRKPVVEDIQDEDDTTTSSLNESVKARAEDEEEKDEYSPWVDILRVLSFLFVASCVLSYTVSSGESFFWGFKNKPSYMRLDWWREHISGPVLLTLDELAAYDGSDPSKPLYLAINGTIYDVSAGRRVYGPGGSYQYFAGVDAARAYVTGCFADDRTADMRGVEQMYLPLDDPATDAHWSSADMERMRADELEAARAKAYKALKHWVDFFAKSEKYSKVGYVVREDDWLEKLPRRELCASAKRGRRKRKIPKD